MAAKTAKLGQGEERPRFCLAKGRFYVFLRRKGALPYKKDDFALFAPKTALLLPKTSLLPPKTALLLPKMALLLPKRCFGGETALEKGGGQFCGIRERCFLLKNQISAVTELEKRHIGHP